ncbi:MAG: ribbon-helix-helix domain-containing protein [Rickettsiales bacterium]|jgi:predicted DNA-binding ribbon-helix-helix protein|nr:ribbon-helix-helix domain-containing protein [Rickettsiales bacterium]
MKKYSVCLFGHYTSITIEDEFFKVLKAIAKKEGKSIARIISSIDEKRKVDDNLSSAVRVFILGYLVKNSNLDLFESK